jgi:hypothetical protein
MKQILPLLVLLYILSCENKQQQGSLIDIDVKADIVMPKHYIITKTNEQINVDGIANENGWQSALFSDLFIDIEGIQTPKFDTKVKMLWDENYLYVFTKMAEPHIWGNLKQRDTIIYFNNDFEIFIAPSGTTRNYAEIEINALGTVWDLLLDKPYRDGGKAISYWNIDGLISAVHIDGSLNDHSDIDSYWTVEMAIPMKALIELKNKPRVLPVEGEQWRLNFSRVEWDYDIVDGAYQRKKDNDSKYLREYNWVWSNQKTINMHQPERWGYLQFTNDATSKNIEFIEDESMHTKQVAYALYRQTKFGSLSKLLQQAAGHIQSFNVVYSAEESLKATFYKTNFGFEFKIKSLPSEQVYIINEAGVLKTL